MESHDPQTTPRNLAPNCAHKLLKKQMVGEFVYYVCECGQKFRIELWDGKVSVLAPPDPRKDLAALDELVTKWRAFAKECQQVIDEPDDEHEHGWARGRQNLAEDYATELEQRLAEMRGAKR